MKKLKNKSFTKWVGNKLKGDSRLWAFEKQEKIPKFL